MNVDTWRLGAVALVITAVIAYAVLSGVWVGTDSTWYRSLEQPSWQPPPWVFGVIWPYNFVALTVVSAVVAWQSNGLRVSALLVFLIASIATALAWAYLFYVPHDLTTAAIASGVGGAATSLPGVAGARGVVVVGLRATTRLIRSSRPDKR